jgi:micrococcal nuclease
MIRFLVFISVLFSACSEILPENEDYHWRTVVKIIDGDSIHLEREDGGKPERIRLIGIDAPETRNTGKKVKHPSGPASKAYLDQLLSDRVVRLEYDIDKTDQYGRTLAYVYLKDGTFINAKMVEEGYAQVATFPPNVRYADYFIRLQNEARNKGKGLWNYND